MTRVALLLALITGACASSPAPISYGSGGGSGRSEQQGAPQRTERRGRAVIEQRGAQQAQAEPREEGPAPPARTPAAQAQPDWADGEGTPLSAYALQPSEVFDPANLPRTHRVEGNESLYDIATRYQVPLRALIDQNNLEPPYALANGRVLDLPPPRFHVVRRGEDLDDIARRFNVDLRSLALLNRMNADDR